VSGYCLGPVVVAAFLSGGAVPFDCQVMLSSLDSSQSWTIAAYAQVFAWTCLLEAPFFVGYALKRGLGWPKAFALLAGANLATHPLVTFALPIIAESSGWVVVYSTLVKEAFAPLVETLVVRRFTGASWVAALGVAFAANLFSWWIGSLLF
jgi:hypothetical protein